MADKLMYIAKNVTPNYPLCITISGSNVWTFNLTNQPMKFNRSPQSSTNIYCKTLGTSEINSPISPPSFWEGEWNSPSETERKL